MKITNIIEAADNGAWYQDEYDAEVWIPNGEVVELADTTDLKSVEHQFVRVQVPPSLPKWPVAQSVRAGNS